MKLILTDIDDVVLQCSDCLEPFFAKETGLVPLRRLRDVHFLTDAFDLKSETITLPTLYKFWESLLFANLLPEPCAQIVIPKLKSLGYRFIGITNCPYTNQIYQSRLDNLKKYFPGVFEGVFCTYGQSKLEALQLYAPAIWVEDNLVNAELGATVGHKTFLLDRPHNQAASHVNPIHRVNNWHDIYQTLEGSNQ